jgi:hypothetical protein
MLVLQKIFLTLDMKTVFRIFEAQLAAADFQYFNMITGYMLHSLANSQSMGIMAAFKLDSRA